VLFKFLTPELAPVSLLESELGFEIVKQLANNGIQISSHQQSMVTAGRVGA
jgi:hypothetical protein